MHDSFSTTIGNAVIMEKSIRKAFAALYAEYNLYEDILQQSKERLMDHLSPKWEADWIEQKGGELDDEDENSLTIQLIASHKRTGMADTAHTRSA